MIPDPEQERQRLDRLYSGMTPEELESVAADGADLTDTALTSLKTEIARRGLAITVNESPAGVDVLEERDLVPIRRFRDLPEAQLAKGSLESSGIECFLTDDNMVRMDWFISNLLGGVKLLVDREDVEAAAAVLNEPTPEILDVEGVGAYEQPRCPECQSLDVNFEQLNRKVAYTSAWLGVPIPLHTQAWTCRACGHRWQDRERVEPGDSEQS
jgi:Putative prokaryotic signal transducing protein